MPTARDWLKDAPSPAEFLSGNVGYTWLVEQGIATRDRVAVFGGSYGGYAVTAALCFSPGTFVCGISLFGPQDLLLHLQ